MMLALQGRPSIIQNLLIWCRVIVLPLVSEFCMFPKNSLIRRKVQNQLIFQMEQFQSYLKCKWILYDAYSSGYIKHHTEYTYIWPKLPKKWLMKHTESTYIWSKLSISCRKPLGHCQLGLGSDKHRLRNRADVILSV